MLGKNQYFLKILSGFSYFTVQILDNATVTKTDNLKNLRLVLQKFDENSENIKFRYTENTKIQEYVRTVSKKYEVDVGGQA